MRVAEDDEERSRYDAGSMEGKGMNTRMHGEGSPFHELPEPRVLDPVEVQDEDEQRDSQVESVDEKQENDEEGQEGRVSGASRCCTPAGRRSVPSDPRIKTPGIRSGKEDGYQRQDKAKITDHDIIIAKADGDAEEMQCKDGCAYPCPEPEEEQ